MTQLSPEMKPLKVVYSQQGVYKWGNIGRELMSLGHAGGRGGGVCWWLGGLPCWSLC